MTDEVSIDLRAKDQMSSVLDHVTQQLGIFNKAGLGIGIMFAGMNTAIQFGEQMFSELVAWIQQGVASSREFELSMARLSESINNFDVPINQVKDDLTAMSIKFAADINVLAGGLQDFIRVGFNAADSLKLLNATMQLATVYGEGLDTTENTVINTMETFGLKASDVSHIISDLNIMTSTTHRSIGDFGTFLGRVTPLIDQYGLSLDTVSAIYVTLSNHGVAARNMITEFEKVLKGTSQYKITILDDSTVADVQTKFDAIDKTTAEYFAKWSKVGDAQQRAIGNTFSQIGLYSNVGWITSQIAGFAEFLGIFKKAVQPIQDYSQAMASANTATMTFADTGLAELMQQAADTRRAIGQLQQDIGDLTSTRDFTIALHNATADVKEYQDAIQSLQRVNDAYNLSVMENSLAISKIEYGADSRHGLTRDQQDQIKALEHTNQGLQIQEQQNQIDMEKIKETGLWQAQDALDAIQKQHDDWQYGVQLRDLADQITSKNTLYLQDVKDLADTYAKEAIASQKFRDNELARTTTWADQMLAQYLKAYGNGSTPIPTTGKTSKSGTSGEGGLPGVGMPPKITPPATHPTAPPAAPPTIPLWKYQHGGLVPETAPALLHKGELVIPKELVGSLMNPREMPHIRLPNMHESERAGETAVTVNNTYQIDIDVSVDGAQIPGNVEEWGRELGARTFVRFHERRVRRGDSGDIPEIRVTGERPRRDNHNKNRQGPW